MGRVHRTAARDARARVDPEVVEFRGRGDRLHFRGEKRVDRRDVEQNRVGQWQRVNGLSHAGGSATGAGEVESATLKVETSMQKLLVLRAQNDAKVVDLSGDWAPDRARGGMGQSLSLSDIGGRKRGNEDDIPYQSWAREKTLSERTSTGLDSR